MNYITITTEKAETFSSISNYFIDYYMPSANGDFVKIYMYLIRMLSVKEPVSIADMAEHFGMSETFVCKAIRYWIGQDVLRLNYNSKKVLTGITLLPLHDKSVAEDSLDSLSMLGIDFSTGIPQSDTTVENYTHDAVETMTSTADMASPAGIAYTADMASTTDIASIATPVTPVIVPDVNSAADNAAKTSLSSDNKPPVKATITPELLRKKQEDDIFSDILFEAEAFYGKTLSASESEILIYIYDQLHFSQELIEYLIEFCLTRGKKSLRYAEAVAKVWYEKGIDTVEKAKEDSYAFNPLFRKIFKELGISRSVPTSAEKAFTDAWSEEMGFSDELIILACKKAIIAKPRTANFSYVNGILEKWYKNGVKSIKDVENLDIEHMKKKDAGAGQPYNAAQKVNGFNNFQQTDMSEQLDALEQLLADDLNRNNKIS